MVILTRSCTGRKWSGLRSRRLQEALCWPVFPRWEHTHKYHLWIFKCVWDCISEICVEYLWFCDISPMISPMILPMILPIIFWGRSVPTRDLPVNAPMTLKDLESERFVNIYENLYWSSILALASGKLTYVIAINLINSANFIEVVLWNSSFYLHSKTGTVNINLWVGHDSESRWCDFGLIPCILLALA